MDNKNTAILEKLIEEDYGLRGNSNWAHAEEHDSLVIDRRRGLFFFNSREIVGDPFIYLTRVRGLTFSDAREYLKRFKDYESVLVYNIKAGESDVVVFPKLVEVFYEMGREAGHRDYFYRRGITDSTIDRFQLGYYNGYNTIPIFQDGVFRNFQLRRDIPDKRIKVYYQGIGGLIYNSDILKITDTAFICEGLTDCLRLSQEGIPAVSHTTGSGGWMPEWFKYFFNQKEIYIIFDADRAGREGAKRTARTLGIYRSKIYCFDGYEDKYDIVDFFRDGGTKDELMSLVKEKSKYIFEMRK